MIGNYDKSQSIGNNNVMPSNMQENYVDQQRVLEILNSKSNEKYQITDNEAAMERPMVGSLSEIRESALDFEK